MYIYVHVCSVADLHLHIYYLYYTHAVLVEKRSIHIRVLGAVF